MGVPGVAFPSRCSQMITGHDIGTGPVFLRLRDLILERQRIKPLILIECKASGKLTSPIVGKRVYGTPV